MSDSGAAVLRIPTFWVYLHTTETFLEKSPLAVVNFKQGLLFMLHNSVYVHEISILLRALISGLTTKH